MTKTETIIEDFQKFLMPNYTRNPVVIVRGEGSRVWDAEGKEYLDLFPGWGVSGIGYCHPKVVKAIQEQAKKIIHMPNNYYNELQGKLAKKISEKSFPGKCFFCNSGAEANEAALKLARKYGSTKNKFEFITMEKSFHGRTYGAMTATGQPKYHKDFKPLLPGFKYVPFGDFDSLKSAVTNSVCAVIVEPIQGEGGVNVASKEYFQKMRKLCSDNDVLLILDEVQTGIGRTGEYFGYQAYGIVPDVMTLAKVLGGGFPIGAIIARQEIADTLVAGTHASTFGGSPLACAAALAVFEAIDEENLLQNSRSMGAYFVERLEQLKNKFNFIKEVRGLGLMLGMELDIAGSKIVAKCIENGLIINCTAGNVIRFLPALNVTKEEIDEGIEILEKVLTEYTN